MDLSTATPQQRQVITTLDKPLMVAAGAGSGKTFTLTQRVAYALLPQSKLNNSAYLTDVDCVLAMTFTKKAANELKSRIKNLLLKEGLIDQALKVDNAWISTIHGICSRILRENAFVLGLDPSFSVIEESEVSSLIGKAFDKVLGVAQEKNDVPILEFVSLYGAQGTRLSPGLKELSQIIIDKTLSTKGGFSSVEQSSVSFDPTKILYQMVKWGNAFIEVSSVIPKKTAQDSRYYDAMKRALSRAENYLSENSGVQLNDDAFNLKAFFEVFLSFPRTTLKYHAKKDDAAFFQEYRETYAVLMDEVEQNIGAYLTNILVDFSERVYREYVNLKGASRLDNTDLLRVTVEAFENNPEIANRYRDHFDLIMVDEFQDTDELQVALLSMLLRDDGSNLCTVGDAQQSIYRFRGADVSVFHDFRDRVRGAYQSASFVNLPDNFRSHQHILKFVDFIFSENRFFGENFLSLNPRSEINNYPDPLFSSIPRIQMQLIDAQQKATKKDARKMSAVSIARHFAKLRDLGASPDDMVILLGSMTNAGLYADALRDEGFESVIAGGSVFSGLTEVKLVESLLAFAQNPLDSLALYQVLSSDLFTCSDSILLALSTSGTGEDVKRQSISLGFLYSSPEEFQDLSSLEYDDLCFIQECLRDYLETISQSGVAFALKRLMETTGYFGRLESRGAEGLAIAGNLYKAFSFISDFEKEEVGISNILNSFRSAMAYSKEAPGVLSTSSSKFVRIMTVHASKGLEFPHVALAEQSLGTVSDTALIVENEQGKTYPFLKPKLNPDQSKAVRELRSFLDSDEISLGSDLDNLAVAKNLRTFREEKELEEAKRLFYVALTRASKSLYVSFAIRGNSSFSYEKNKLIQDLFSVVRWDLNNPVQEIDYGSDTPMRFLLTYLTAPYELSVEESVRENVSEDKKEEVQKHFSAQKDTFSEKKRDENTFPLDLFDKVSYTETVPERLNGDVVSYSSLSRDQKASVSIETIPEDSLSFSLSQTQDEALLFGTFFHQCAQKLVLQASWQKDRSTWFSQFDKEAYLSSCLEKFVASDQQKNRFVHILEQWLHQPEFKELLSCESISAEVPFMVQIPGLCDEKYLEGEIDALGCNRKDAFFIDYKTGGSLEETSEMVYHKHLLQAQCYSYALLREGFQNVRGVFVRVDFLDNPSAVRNVSYSFSQKDLMELEQKIRECCTSNVS